MKTARAFGMTVLAVVASILAGACSSQPPPKEIDLNGDDGAITSAAYLPAKNDALVRTPRLASGVVSLRAPGSNVSVRFAMANAGDVEGQDAGGTVRYRRAFRGGDIVRETRANGIEDFVSFAERPPREEIAYAFTTAGFAGLRLVANTLEMLDANGAPRLRVDPPYLIGAGGARIDATLGVDDCLVDTDPRAPWDRPVVSPGAASCTLTVRWRNARYPATLDPTWELAGTLPVRVQSPAVHLLSNGKIFVAGGAIYGTTSQSTAAYLYDPNTKTASATGSMSVGRQDMFSFLGPSDRVFVGGGLATNPEAKTSEYYDLATGVFTAGPALQLARQGARATDFESSTSSGTLISGGGQQQAEIFGSQVTGFDTSARTDSVAVELPSKKVFVAAGGASTASYYYGAFHSFTATAQTPTFKPNGVAGVLLKDGTVLLVGGYSGNSFDNSAFVYDPTADTFTTVGSLTAARSNPAMALLEDGRVLVGGGSVDQTSGLSSIEIYDPIAKTFSLGPTMSHGRSGFTIVPLSGGRAVAIGDSTDIEVLDDLPLGAACADGSECHGNLCVDGVCCDTSCTGQCEACDIAGHEGTCTPAKGLAHGKAKACAGTDATCGGTCDGIDTKVCSFAQASSACGVACANGQLSSSSCNGQGACVVSDSHACPGNYACADATTCGTTCSTKDQCAAGFSCKDGNCVQTAKCVSDRISQAIDGTRAECAPYRCDDSATGDGTCKTSCASVDDCVGGDVCSSEHTCVAATQSSDSGGCNIGRGRRSTGSNVMWLALILGIARRRRSRTTLRANRR